MSDYLTIRSRAATIGGRTGIVWVAGPDAVTFLDGLLSQNVATLAQGTIAPSLLLAPNGKLRATLWLLRGQDRVGLVCDAERVDVVAADLARFKIRVDVEIEPEQRPVWEVWGPRAEDFVAVMPAEGTWREDELVFSFPFRHSPLPRVGVVGEQPTAPPVSDDAVTAVRVEVGEPVMGIDLTDSTIPQEGADVTAAVDFAKGCYLGQELVARIDSRGHVNRRLTGVVFAGSERPPVGADVSIGEKPIGTLTSVALSEGKGAPIALAMLRVEAGSGAAVTAAGVEGVVRDLPLRP